jgi:U3 small nucleolar RNA-associated protein 7
MAQEREDDGNDVGTIGISRGYTESKQAKKRLAQLQQQQFERRKNKNNSSDNPDGYDDDDEGATNKKHRNSAPVLTAKAEKELIARYDVDRQNQQRIDRLKHDTSFSSRLTDYQHRALAKRQRLKNNATQAKLTIQKTKRYEAAVAAADAEVVLNTVDAGLLEAEHDMERTTALSQVELKRKYLNEQSARHIYNLDLQHHGPYGCKFDRSGRYSILFGQRGHIALMDAHTLALKTEFHVQERIRDVCYLHNSTLFATAQTKHVYIYDDKGAEVHQLTDHIDPFVVDFLPYHWLLASIGRPGYLKYQDTSTGQLVSQHRTKLGPCKVMRQNPSNAVMHCGHTNGTVTLWSPASPQYLAKVLAHKGAPITSLAVDLSGNYMITGGVDRQLKVWDLRKFQCTHSYFVPSGQPSSLDLSQRDVIGIGHGCHATFWSADALKRKVQDPYMHHLMPACDPIETIRFRPFEDVCVVGHNKGISSIVIPGSGEPNIDTSEYNLNPFQDKRQRREVEVRALLDKLDPNMITLDPNEIGGMEESTPEIRRQRLQDIQEAADEALSRKPKKREKSKKRGRSKIQTKLRRKQRNVVDEQMLKLREAREKEKAEAEAQGSGTAIKKRSSNEGDGGTTDMVSSDGPNPTAKISAPSALKRFF